MLVRDSNEYLKKVRNEFLRKVKNWNWDVEEEEVLTIPKKYKIPKKYQTNNKHEDNIS